MLWVNGAVGFLGNEDNPANLLFLGVIAIAVVGAVLGTFRAAAMARAMFSAVAAQLLVGAAPLVFGLGSPRNNGFYDAVLGTVLFGSLWLISGALFRKVATDEAQTAVRS